MARNNNRRHRMLAAVKQQLADNDIEYTPSKKEQGSRSSYKDQRNNVNKIKRWAARTTRQELQQQRYDRGTDSYGRDWTPMEPGTLIQFVKNDRRWNSSAKKGDLATVVKEFETDGKRLVEALIGAQVVTIAKSFIKEV